MMKRIVFLLAIGMIVLVRCGSKKDALPNPGPGPGGGGFDCNGVTSTFAATVKPIIQANCLSSGCHDAASTNGPGPLTTYEKVRDAAARIRPAIISRTMPKGGSLTADQIKSIVCWIDNGSQNN